MTISNRRFRDTLRSISRLACCALALLFGGFRGAGYVSGGLTAGLLYGAVFVTLESIIAKLGQDYSALHGVSAWLVHFTALLPALIGIGLGRNPSGFLHDGFARWRAMMRDAKGVLVAGLGAELLIWFLAFRHTINNWTFALVTAALVVLVPQLGSLLDPATRRRRRGVDDAADLPDALRATGVGGRSASRTTSAVAFASARASASGTVP